LERKQLKEEYANFAIATHCTARSYNKNKQTQLVFMSSKQLAADTGRTQCAVTKE